MKKVIKIILGLAVFALFVWIISRDMFRNIIDPPEPNPRLIEVVAVFGKDTLVLKILTPDKRSAFKAGEKAVISRHYGSSDAFLAERGITPGMFVSKSVDHAIHDLGIVHDGGWYLEGIGLHESVVPYGYVYEINKYVTVIHDPKND